MPMVSKVEKVIEVPQVQYVDKVVPIPVQKQADVPSGNGMLDGGDFFCWETFV